MPTNVCESVLSHNFDINILKQAIDDNDLSYIINNKDINVLTIGGIRDYEQNAAIIEALGNQDDFLVSFVGRGIDAPRLEEFAKNGNYRNVIFSGYYDKKDEASIIQRSTIMNIFILASCRTIQHCQTVSIIPYSSETNDNYCRYYSRRIY